MAVARFQHETCTFCPGDDMGIDDWTRIRPPFGGNGRLRRMSISTGPVVIRCTECAQDRLTRPDEWFTCEVCGTGVAEVLCGRELELAALEIES
ncbi:MAG TPA: hypothetical protein VMO26_28445 [Vicinamibacterales bacterium]|nr:hypothetical protein [Vicinamibacterales bacterium]